MEKAYQPQNTDYLQEKGNRTGGTGKVFAASKFHIPSGRHLAVPVPCQIQKGWWSHGKCPASFVFRRNTGPNPLTWSGTELFQSWREGSIIRNSSLAAWDAHIEANTSQKHFHHFLWSQTHIDCVISSPMPKYLCKRNEAVFDRRVHKCPSLLPRGDKSWKESKCSLTDKWINRLKSVQRMGLYLVLKRKIPTAENSQNQF